MLSVNENFVSCTSMLNLREKIFLDEDFILNLTIDKWQNPVGTLPWNPKLDYYKSLNEGN